MSKPLISILTPTYNESENISILIQELIILLTTYSEKYLYEIIIIDNDSIDNTVKIVKEICFKNENVKLIINSRNFGHIKSPFHGLLQAGGDAVILMASDFQDPIYLIHQHIQNWENGFLMSLAIKNNAEENWLFYNIRKLFYKTLSKLSETNLIENYTGSGLYDKKIINILKSINDPYPYFRGLISEIGFEKSYVYFNQPTRKRGFTKNNFYTLYDIAMLGITSYSKIPLRLATMLGFMMSGMSLIVAIIYLFMKLTLWNNFPAGNAPTVIGLFFFASVQLLFIGILGEYIGSIHTLVQKRPMVIEKERINF